jgi:uncharacterized phage-like protein YoqJ
MRIALTGHRPNKLYGYKLENKAYYDLSEKIKRLVLKLAPEGSVELISGMALGADTVFALTALDMREDDERFTLHCAIPCKGYSSNWFGESVDTYNLILAQADSSVVVTDSEYEASFMQRRNEYMVDRCDVLIAIWNGTPGGTYNCVKYAHSVGKRIIVIKP